MPTTLAIPDAVGQRTMTPTAGDFRKPGDIRLWWPGPGQAFDDGIAPSHLAVLDFGAAFAEPSICPACGSSRITAHDARDKTYFSCETCHAEWSVELGQIVRATTRHEVAGPR